MVGLMNTCSKFASSTRLILSAATPAKLSTMPN